MKLLFKKTGEVENVCLVMDKNKIAVVVADMPLCGNSVLGEYNTLAELNEEWEDYKPAEPLIKDEKIRKAVRAWAEAFDVEKIYCDAKMLRLHDSKCKTVIGIKYPILGVWDRKEPYTLAELCGEEEE